MGQVVGESASKVDIPAGKPIGPQDLKATIFHVLGRRGRHTFISHPAAGEPWPKFEQPAGFC